MFEWNVKLSVEKYVFEVIPVLVPLNQ